MTAKEKIKKLERALEALKKAEALFREVAEDQTTPSPYPHFLTADAQYYQAEVGQLVSCDHGEAGLEPFIERLTKKYL